MIAIIGEVQIQLIAG